MATERLFEIKLLGLQKDKKKVLDFLQELGVLHISEISNKLLKQDLPVGSINEISNALLELKWINESLSAHYELPNKDFVFKPKPLNNVLDSYKILKSKIFKELSKNIKALEKNNKVKEELLAKFNLLKRIPFDYNGLNLEQGKYLFKYVLYMGGFDDNFRLLIKKHITKVSYIKIGDYMLIVGLNEVKEEIDKIIKDNNIEILNVPKLKQSKDFEIKLILHELREIHKQNHHIETYLKNLASKHLGKIRELYEELSIFHDRYNISQSLGSSRYTFAIKAFLPVKEVKRFRRISKIAEVYVEFIKPRDAPSKLRNLPYVKSYEFITKMFGLPRYLAIDPTVYLSMFIPFFFGFMFSDIGYGIMLLGLSGFLLMKAYQYPNHKILKDAGVVMAVNSLSTIFFGALFGSFFGNLIKIKPLLFDPFQNSKYILIISLVIGLLHINLGLLLAIIDNIKFNRYKEIFVDNLAVISLELSIAFFFLSNMPSGVMFLLLSMILLIVKSSLMGIMDITAFIGTWFSYARLLALSLATGGIALGINIMAEQLSNLRLLGPILFIILIIFGHAFNFLMNVLGSTIHSVRLHYIEFFSQFYEAGGKPFEAYSTKRIKDSL
jgi:V/A-type H+-transporting ATPase subunit I